MTVQKQCEGFLWWWKHSLSQLDHRQYADWDIVPEFHKMLASGESGERVHMTFSISSYNCMSIYNDLTMFNLKKVCVCVCITVRAHHSSAQNSLLTFHLTQRKARLLQGLGGTWSLSLLASSPTVLWSAAVASGTFPFTALAIALSVRSPLLQNTHEIYSLTSSNLCSKVFSLSSTTTTIFKTVFSSIPSSSLLYFSA